jgi:hypothetical protein
VTCYSRLIAAVAFLGALPASAGPISKFDDNTPAAAFTTARGLADVERCLIDMDGWPLPVTYRQPDRPDRVTIMWSVSDKALGRVDLAATPSGTAVTAWIKGKQFERCAPRG